MNNKPRTTQRTKLPSTQVHAVLEQCMDFCEQHGIAFMAAYEDASYRVHTFQNIPAPKSYPETMTLALKELGEDIA